MNKKINQIVAGDFLSFFLLMMGFVEFLVVAIINLGAGSDSKTAILFGYSVFRLAFFLIITLIAFVLLFVAFSSNYRSGFIHRLDSLVKIAPQVVCLVLFLLLIMSVIIWMIPFEMLGKYGQVFDRIRLFLFVLCLYPVQFSIYWIKTKTFLLDRGLIQPFLIGFGTLIGLASFIQVTGLGIIPDNKSWNPAGTPITALQFMVVLFFGITLVGVFGILKQGRGKKSEIYFDILITLSLYLVAFYAWMVIPNPYNEFSNKLVAPYYQALPSSDAAVHDIGGLSILNGSGIFLGEYTDKPLYMVFLAILHLFAGFDYNLLTIFQVGILALMIPILYFFGKSFHSRLFGFIIACIVLLRQYNGISLTRTFTFMITPRQLMTEVPTLLGLIVFAWALFESMNGTEERKLRVFLAGVLLGAVTLIRLNPFLLILAVPFFFFYSNQRQKKIWLKRSLIFILGCAIVITPWIVTGKDSTGNPYFLVKFFDVINVRYKPNSSLRLDNNLASLPTPSRISEIAPLMAGISVPPIPIDKFPGFVFNYTLNNFIGSFLTLPDSMQRNDQNLVELVKRPYWMEGKYAVTPGQIPIMVVNLVLISLGLGWSWKRWSWAGISPLFVFVVYSVSLGLGRTSGSRYLPPIDWVVNFYFVIGLLGVFLVMPRAIRRIIGFDPDVVQSRDGFSVSKEPKWKFTCVIILTVLLSGLIPAAQLLIPSQVPICKTENLDSVKQVLSSQGMPVNFQLVYGQILFPQVKKDQLAFELLTCDKHNYYEIDGFHEKISIGEMFLFGLATEGKIPDLLLIANSPKNGEDIQIIWKKGLK